MSKELKKMIIVAITIVLLIATIGFLVFNHTEKQRAIYAEFVEKFNSSEKTLLYIGKPTCPYCSLLEPSLVDMKERYDFDYLYLNIEEVNAVVISQILEDLDLTTIGTPYLTIVSDGKVIDSQNGYADYDMTFEFLQKNGIIAKDAKLSLNYIDLEEYKKLLSGEENEIVVVAQSTCSYCVKAKLIFNDIAEEKGTKINYLNVSYFESEEEVTEFGNSLEYLQSEWGTPVTMIINNGKLVDYIEGLATKETYISFFEKHGVL